MVMALLVVMMVFVRLLVSFLLVILMFRMFRVFIMERSVDVVFRYSIFWILPPISAGVQVCKIARIRRDLKIYYRERFSPIWAPVRPVANQGITFAVSFNDISPAEAILVHEKRISPKDYPLDLVKYWSICFLPSLFTKTWKIRCWQNKFLLLPGNFLLG